MVSLLLDCRKLYGVRSFDSVDALLRMTQTKMRESIGFFRTVKRVKPRIPRAAKVFFFYCLFAPSPKDDPFTTHACLWYTVPIDNATIHRVSRWAAVDIRRNCDAVKGNVHHSLRGV